MNNKSLFIKLYVLIIIFIFCVIAFFYSTSSLTKNSRERLVNSIKQFKYKITNNQSVVDLDRRAELIGNMINIPSGSFSMGSHSNNQAKPVHQVTLQSFQISEKEITFAQWDLCVADNWCSVSPSDEHWGRNQRPVINVSPNNILNQYIPWLNFKTGLKFELPSEAQWEYAARATSEKAYSWGEQINCQDANFGFLYTKQKKCGSSKQGRTKIVGSYPPNLFGLYDMHGNVKEITQDELHHNYNGAPNDGSAWKTNKINAFHMVRGGAYSSSGNFISALSRENMSFYESSKDIGFRLVLNN